MSSYTEVTNCTIDGYGVTDDFIRGEVWRTVSAIGRWAVILENGGGTYNNTFDVQDSFQLDIEGNTVMQGRVDGPGVTVNLIDAEDDFKEFIIIQGVDQAQDFLFHDDFAYLYSLTTRTIGWILDDVINTQIGYGAGIGQTNIIYADPGGTPVVGAVEFREGASFLGTIQDMHRRINWMFYVDDALTLRNGAPGFSASGQFIRCVENDEDNNVLRRIDWNRRSGDKLYNYIKIYGKNPLFDAYTEYNALDAEWTSVPVGALSNTNPPVGPRVGAYAIMLTGVACGSHIYYLTFPGYNYTTIDMTKGKIGVWFLFEDPGGVCGTPNQRIFHFRLRDVGNNEIDYYGNSTRCWIDEWGWLEATLGEDVNLAGAVPDQWTLLIGAAPFDWSQVNRVSIWGAHVAPHPQNTYIDGLTLPIPPLAIAQDVPSQTAYRWRPLPLTLSYVRTQNALQSIADDLLAHHKETSIDYLKLMIEGNTSLCYAGQSVTVNIPDLDILNDIYYMPTIHHVIEPRVDVSGGFGYDYVTEVEMIPVTAVSAYDARRLSDQPVVSSYNLASKVGTGVRMK